MRFKYVFIYIYNIRLLLGQILRMVILPFTSSVYTNKIESIYLQRLFMMFAEKNGKKTMAI